MKVAILSDIHGNRFALQSVVDCATREGVDQWIFLGDLVGYYYWPKECLEMLRDLDATCIQGNHDRMMLNAISDDAALAKITASYGHGVEVALQQLNAQDIDDIANWPDTVTISVDGHSTRLCHGTPWDRDEYVYPDAHEDVRENMSANHKGVTLFGHTHHQVFWNTANGPVCNPGSVGQPRNYQPGAQWALWDTETMDFEFRCDTYTQNEIVKACQLNDPENTYLTEVLRRSQS